MVETAKRILTKKVTIGETIRIGVDQIVEIGEFSVDKITEADQGMNKAIGTPLEEETLEVK